MPESHYAQFFARVMEQVDLPVAIQNAPEYTGVGLSDAALRELARIRPNFVLLKGEGPALTIRRSIEALHGALAVFNGRGGLELPDNLRAGCAGMIPATDTFDYQVRVFECMRSGDDDAGRARLPRGPPRHRVRHAVPRHPDLLWQTHRRLATGPRGRARPLARPRARCVRAGLRAALRAALGPLP